MVDIVYGGLPQQQGGGESWIDKLLPIGVLAVMGYIAYKLLLGSGETAQDGSTWTGAGGQGGSLQAANQAQQQLPASSLQGYSIPGADTLTNIIKGVSPGATVIKIPTQPSTPIFVTAGPSTPSSFAPGGQGVITTSRDVSDSEAVKVLENLYRSDIPNAWWSQEQTITQTKQPGGINAAGSFQSNIPVGQRHCPCTPALRLQGVCGAGDDWYIC